MNSEEISDANMRGIVIARDADDELYGVSRNKWPMPVDKFIHINKLLNY